MVTICLIIFLLAISVRLFHWQDNRPIFPKLFTGMVEHYNPTLGFSLTATSPTLSLVPAPPSDANILTYPPGYPIILSVVFKVFGKADAAMRCFQIVCDAGAAMLVFLIAAELLPVTAAAIAGALAALSPQLAYYSLILIPDSLATLPILLAIYFIIRAKKSNSFRSVVAAGVLVGVSCWFRANALIMAPFLAVVLLVTMHRARRCALRFNARCRHHPGMRAHNHSQSGGVSSFHPALAGRGPNVNFGITDFDKERRYSLPGTDIETVTSEAANNVPNTPPRFLGSTELSGTSLERRAL